LFLNHVEDIATMVFKQTSIHQRAFSSRVQEDVKPDEDSSFKQVMMSLLEMRQVIPYLYILTTSKSKEEKRKDEKLAE